MAFGVLGVERGAPDAEKIGALVGGESGGVHAASPFLVSTGFCASLTPTRSIQ